ncbi:MAG: hypothetical protein ABI905_09190 [Betaproteobacteria bacterium]
MNAGSSPVKFTDGLEREWIGRESEGADGRGVSDESVRSLLKWVAAVSIAVGLLLIIAHGGHGVF